MGTPVGSAPERLIQFFTWHNPTPEQQTKIDVVNSTFLALATFIENSIHPNPERTLALRHLLDSKTAAVRSILAKSIVIFLFSVVTTAEAACPTPILDSDFLYQIKCYYDKVTTFYQTYNVQYSNNYITFQNQCVQSNNTTTLDFMYKINATNCEVRYPSSLKRLND